MLKFSEPLSPEITSLDPSQYKILIKIKALENEYKGVYNISEFKLSQDRTELSSVISFSKSIGSVEIECSLKDPYIFSDSNG